MKKKLKTVTLMLALALPVSLMAQDGLFKRGDIGGQNDAVNSPLMHRSGEMATHLSNQGFGNPINGSNLTNQTFGAPLGSGLLIMLLAGAGYTALKSNKKNKE